MWKVWLEFHTGCRLHGRQVATKLQRTSLSSLSAQARTTPLKRVHLRDGNADLVTVKKPARTFVSLPNSESKTSMHKSKFITGDGCIQKGQRKNSRNRVIFFVQMPHSALKAGKRLPSPVVFPMRRKEILFLSTYVGLRNIPSAAHLWCTTEHINARPVMGPGSWDYPSTLTRLLDFLGHTKRVPCLFTGLCSLRAVLHMYQHTPNVRLIPGQVQIDRP